MDSTGFVLTDPVALLSALGAAGLFLGMVAETRLLIGFFLPGDALLFTAGILATTDARAPAHIALPVAIVAAAAGAILGCRGATLFRRCAKHRLHAGVRRGSDLLAWYGPGKAIVLARFVPVARTALSTLAGLANVPARTFLLWQSLGGLSWTTAVTFAGYFFGDAISDVDQYLLPVVLIIVVLSAVPPAARSHPITYSL